MTVEDKQLQPKVEETGRRNRAARRPHGGFSMMTSGRRRMLMKKKRWRPSFATWKTQHGIGRFDDLREILENWT